MPITKKHTIYSSDELTIDLATWAFGTIICVAVAVGITLLVMFYKQRRDADSYRVK